jgi:Glycosyltransferase family 87
MKFERIHILLLAFLVCFIVFQAYPSLMGGVGYLYFKTLPSYTDRIGVDLQQMLSYSKELLNGRSPYIGNNIYPSLASIVFIPFCLMDFRSAYMFITMLTLCSYWAMFYLAQKIVGKVAPETVLIFVAGLFSYGLAFSLERGQFYAITMALLMWALYLYHYTDRKYLAWTLFIIATQLKIFPVFSIFLMVNKNES